MLTANRQQTYSKPAYKKVEEDLRARIRNGHWVRGAMLPGRKALAVEYGVNLDTIQRGIKQLVEEGILVADSRRGTFVASEGLIAMTETAEALPPRDFQEQIEATSPLVKHSIIGLACRICGEANPVHMRCLDAMETSALDVDLICRSINLYRDHPENELSFGEAARQLAESNVEGIILMGGYGREQVNIVELASLNIPIVVVSLREERWPMPTVCYDQRDAGQSAGRHLLDQGCRDLLYFSLSTDQWAIDRRTGVREALMMANIPSERLLEYVVDEAAALPYKEYHRLAKAAAMDWLRRGIPFDGVVAANDMMAVAFMEAAKDRGFLAGSDYAIVGFDDQQNSRFLGLSSLRPPVEDMGREALSLLRAAIRGGQISRRVSLHSKLIMRESSLLKR